MLKCNRCKASWEPRKPEPVQCPRCKSLRWDHPAPPVLGAVSPAASKTGGLPRGGIVKIDREPTRAIVSKSGATWCDCGGQVLLIHAKDFGKIGFLSGRCASCNARLRVKSRAAADNINPDPTRA